MGGPLSTAGAIGLSAGLGAGGNLLAAGINAIVAKRQQERQFQYNELAADNADKRTRALYNDLYSPAAQMEQIKAAGLSPSIYASGGIAGKQGVSGAQGAGVAQAPVFGVDPIGAALAGAQIAKTKAETNNINADTNNKKKTNGLIDAQIIDTYANAGLKTAQTSLTQVQTGLEQVQLNIASATESAQVQGVLDNLNRVFYESVIAQHEADRRGLLYKKESALFQTEINKSIAEYENMLMDLSVKSAGIQLTQAQAKSLLETVNINWYNANTNRESAHAQGKYLEEQVKQWAVQNEIDLQKLDQQKTQMWIDGVCRVVGTLGNVACAALGADTISNNQTTYVETAEDVYDKNGSYKGTKHRTQKTYKK